jgi:hypothetical protein
LHYVSATVIAVGLTAAVLLGIRRGRALGLRGLTAASIGATAVAFVAWVAAFVLSGSPPTEIVGLTERIGIYVGWAWLVVVGLLELRPNRTAAG